MITKEQVKHIAKLARISLTEEEEEKFQKELSLILDYVEKLKEVDISNVQASFHLIPEATFKKGMREDKSKRQDLKTVKKLIEAAPKKKEGHIRTKAVL